MKNQMAFTNVESAYKLIHFLMDYNVENKDEGYFNDIHITADEDLVVVEWVQTPPDGGFGGFKYIEDEEDIIFNKESE